MSSLQNKKLTRNHCTINSITMKQIKIKIYILICVNTYKGNLLTGSHLSAKCLFRISRGMSARRITHVQTQHVKNNKLYIFYNMKIFLRLIDFLRKTQKIFCYTLKTKISGYDLIVFQTITKK